MEPYFQRGNEAEIFLAKKEYRRLYKRQWRNEFRAANKELTISLNKEELKEVKNEAGKHKFAITQFIKQAVFGYINKRYIPINKNEINKILQLVALSYNCIEELKEEHKVNNEIAAVLQETINHLDHELHVILNSPNTLWHILSNTLTEYPYIKQELILYLESFSV